MTEPVRFTVVTPTHRRPESLHGMLEALSRQTYPADRFEVVVVHDGDRDAVLQPTSYPFRFRAVGQDRAGPAAARNRGIAMAEEAHLLFLDDDVLPRPTLVEEHARSHAEPGAVVIGPLLAADIEHPAPWTRWEWRTLAEQYDAMREGRWVPTPRQFYTGNASVSTSEVRAVGGFNCSFTRGEDVELAWRLHDRGLRFVFNERAAAQHLAQRSFQAWLAAAFDYGRTDVLLEGIRSGRDLPGWVGREFRSRHTVTRRLTKVVLAHPVASRLVPAIGVVATHATDAARLRRTSMQLCSALFTTAYWRGVAAQLGPERALALLESGSRGEVREEAA